MRVGKKKTRKRKEEEELKELSLFLSLVAKSCRLEYG
jgi:hypothetical protein